MPEVLEVLVEAGKASPGPPLGPALGPMGVNIMEIVKSINDRTKHFEGMKVPVKLIIDPLTKSYEIEVGTPPTSALIMKELKIEKGSGEASKIKVGNLTLAQAKKIAEMKGDSMLGLDLKKRTMEVLGTCVSMGVSVESKDPREIQKEIKEGKHDNLFKG